MPIFEINCRSCGMQSEVLVINSNDQLICPECGGHQTDKIMSATSSLTGQEGQMVPGRQDTACCGQSPAHASCAGPGSCCGKTG
jgi:putative FmdB family regulatory protein